MRKAVYFVIEAIWTIVFSSFFWYLVLKNMSFDFYHNSDDTIAGIILLSGLTLYVILTVCYIILGVKKVKGWRWWMDIITLVISAAMSFTGMFCATYGAEFLNRIL